MTTHGKRYGIAFLTVAIAFEAHAAPTPFPDMTRSWFGYRNAVSFLQGKDVIHGYPDGNFYPTKDINRAEFLKLVFQTRGGHEPVSGSCFSDVPKDAWFAPFVCAAERRGIVEGYPDGTFRPEQAVNTAEALKILLHAYGGDVPEERGENWYEPYAKEFDRREILPRDFYVPWENLTRERASDLIVRFFRLEEERIVPLRSQGCGKPLADAPSSVTVDGLNRSFLLTVPEGYLSHEPSPLIVAFHGRTNSNERVRSYFGLDREAENYFLAYPAALQNTSGSFHWAGAGDEPGWVRDVAFFDALVEKISDTYCIDMNRIFVVGHSLGAWMANSVACIRGDVVRGSATVGGDSIFTDCTGTVASLMIHHKRDNLASFAGAERAKEQRVKENFCLPDSLTTEPQTLQCIEYRNCDGGNPVVWCPHELDIDPQGNFYPHNWPRITAQTIVEFFGDLE